MREITTTQNFRRKFCVTGHRPHLIFAFGKNCYQPEVYKELIKLAICSLNHFNPDLIYTGMAQGWDQAVAEGCCFLGIPYIACIPYEGQEKIWPKKAQIKYRELLSKASGKIITWTGDYQPDVFYIRDQYMVDNCDEVLAFYNGEAVGGTRYTIKYANSKNKPVHNIYQNWKRKFECSQAELKT